MTFSSGDVVKIGDPRWFDLTSNNLDYIMPSSLIRAETNVLILDAPVETSYRAWRGGATVRYQRTYVAFVMWRGLIGRIRLTEWLDEKV